MAITIQNNKPITLSPIYSSKIAGPFSPHTYIGETLAKPLWTPFQANTPVTIKNGTNPMTEDDIIDLVIKSCGDSRHMPSEDLLKEILNGTLVYYDKKSAAMMSANELFAVQAGVQEKLPMPTPTIIYSPATDVIPTAREFLGGKCTPEKFFASLAFFARPATLGFYFANERTFDAFKTWFDTQCQSLQSAGLTSPDTNKILADFQAVKLDNLTEAFLLRQTDQQNNEEYSFARIFIAFLMNYTTQVSNAEFGCLPFFLGELYCPRTVVLVNVEKHSRASAKAVRDEWDMVNGALRSKVNVISKNALSKLTATQRSLKKIASSAAQANSMLKNAQRAKRMKFSKTQPKVVDMARIIRKVISKMAFVAKSENVYKCTKTSFLKANRRNPDDYNKPGQLQRITYKPDIHLYIDTSGSVTEQNYQDAVRACINMAKTMNVNLYFNSFSHVLSSCTKMRCKDKSVAQIYNEFIKTPKVTGGTDYEQIWHYINKSRVRSKELSIIMTDFEWWAHNNYVKHPKNLYYIPLSHMDWDNMVRCAESFCKSMMHNDPNCRSKLLF